MADRVKANAMLLGAIVVGGTAWKVGSWRVISEDEQTSDVSSGLKIEYKWFGCSLRRTNLA